MFLVTPPPPPFPRAVARNESETGENRGPLDSSPAMEDVQGTTTSDVGTPYEPTGIAIPNYSNVFPGFRDGCEVAAFEMVLPTTLMIKVLARIDFVKDILSRNPYLNIEKEVELGVGYDFHEGDAQVGDTVIGVPGTISFHMFFC